jgi:hypothetical protein
VSVLSSFQMSYFSTSFRVFVSASSFYGSNFLHILQKPGFPDVPGREIQVNEIFLAKLTSKFLHLFDADHRFDWIRMQRTSALSFLEQEAKQNSCTNLDYLQNWTGCWIIHHPIMISTRCWVVSMSERLRGGRRQTEKGTVSDECWFAWLQS